MRERPKNPVYSFKAGDADGKLCYNPTLPDKKERTLSETTAWGSFFENNIDLHQKTLRVEAKVRSWPRVKRSLGMEMSKELRIIQRSSDSTLTNL